MKTSDKARLVRQAYDHSPFDVTADSRPRVTAAQQHPATGPDGVGGIWF